MTPATTVAQFWKHQDGLADDGNGIELADVGTLATQLTAIAIHLGNGYRDSLRGGQLTAMVVLPVPPLPPAMAMTVARSARSGDDGEIVSDGQNMASDPGRMDGGKLALLPLDQGFPDGGGVTDIGTNTTCLEGLGCFIPQVAGNN